MGRFFTQPTGPTTVASTPSPVSTPAPVPTPAPQPAPAPAPSVPPVLNYDQAPTLASLYDANGMPKPGVTTRQLLDAHDRDPSNPMIQFTNPNYKPEAPRKGGLVDAFLTGGPSNPQAGYYGKEYDPDYKPSFAESIVAGLTSPIRAAGEALGNELNPSMREARSVFDDMRKNNPNDPTINDLESKTLGPKNSLWGNSVKFVAGAAEAALNIYLMGAASKVKLGEGVTKVVLDEAGNVIPKAAPTFVEKVVEIGSKLGHSALEGGKYGTLYGGLYGLQQYPEDWGKAAEKALEGGVVGAVSMPFLHGLAMLGGKGLTMASNAVNSLWEKTSNKLPIWALSPRDAFTRIANQLSEAGHGDIAEYWKGFAAKKDALDAETRTAMGELQHSMTMTGQIQAPNSMVAKKLGIDGKFFAPGGGGDEAAMAEGTAILRGLGKYADPKVQAEAINSNPIFQEADKQRVVYGATSQAKGVWDGKTLVGDEMRPYNPKTYAPQSTPVVELTPASKKALANATTPEEKLKILMDNDPNMKRNIDFSVDVAGNFKDRLQAYETYYDYTSFVKGDGRVPNKENKFLQWMVQNDTTGKIKNVSDAAEALLKQESTKKAALTGRASSLDYQRDFDLPWYDTNIARTMSNYSFDAITRNKYAQYFGAGDEHIIDALQKVSKASELGRDKPVQLQQQLEDLVRTVMGTSRSTGINKTIENVSRWVRTMQVPKVTWSAIRNLGQTLNNPLNADIPSTLKGLGMAFSDEGVTNAMKSGVLLDSYMKQAYEFANGNTGIANAIYKWSGFSHSEMVNRAVGSNVANFYYESQLKNLAKRYGVVLGDATEGKTLAAAQDAMDQEVAKEFTKLRASQPDAKGADLYKMAQDRIAMDFPELAANSSKLESKKADLAVLFKKIEAEKSPEYWALKDAGIDIHDVLAKGYLSEADKAAAAYRFVEKTQFSGNPMDLPTFSSSPIGKVIMQFKTFGWRQSQLALGTLKDQLARGQVSKALKTLTYLGTIVPMGNAALQDVRSLITQEKVPTTALDQWHNNLFDAASFGLASDFIRKANEGNVIDWMVGPAPNDFANYMEGIVGTASALSSGNVKGAKSKAGTLIKQVGRSFGLGPVVNTIMPTKTPGASTLDILSGKTKQNFFTGKKKS